MFPSVFRVIGPTGPGEGAPKPSLDRWGCLCKISSRLMQGFRFLLALHVPADKETYVHLYAHIYIGTCMDM